MAGVYVPRSPMTGVLYGVVRTHLADFLAAVDARTDGSGLPPFVAAEFRKFLRCGGRRMAERAAHLVDHVLPPHVPVRQWVLSVPHRLRYRLGGAARAPRAAGAAPSVLVTGEVRRGTRPRRS